jgi:hypothetical protein
MSYHQTGSCGGYEIARPVPTGAVALNERLKGWLSVAAILGFAFFAMKYLAPSGKPKKRKNPKRAISRDARERQRELGRRRARQIWHEALSEADLRPASRVKLAKAYKRKEEEERKGRRARKVAIDVSRRVVAAKKAAATRAGYKWRTRKKSLKRKPRRTR